MGLCANLNPKLREQKLARSQGQVESEASGAGRMEMEPWQIFFYTSWYCRSATRPRGPLQLASHATRTKHLKARDRREHDCDHHELSMGLV